MEDDFDEIDDDDVEEIDDVEEVEEFDDDDADVEGAADGAAWAGPGSDEPAPSLTIRADLAAATASARQRASAPVEDAPVAPPEGKRRRLSFRR